METLDRIRGLVTQCNVSHAEIRAGRQAEYPDLARADVAMHVKGRIRSLNE